MDVRFKTDAWAVCYWILASLVVAGLLLTGHMQPWVSPDSASWLAPGWSLASFESFRFPLYGWLYNGLMALGLDDAAWPWLQDGSFIAASWWLALAVRHRGYSPAAAFAIGAAPLLSSVMLLWGRAILPDVLAASALLAALACTISSASRVTLASMFGTLAYLLKPGLLPFIGGLPVILLLDGPPRFRAAGGLLMGLAAPFLLISALRLATVGDFNIVSFGGFQMSGIAGLMLTPDTAAQLPPGLRADADDIIARRDALIASGRALAVPLNASAIRSFASAAAGYPDLFARTYDNILYGAIAPTQRPAETWPAFNARLQHLALATISVEPFDYAAWIAGGLARLLGRMLVFNPGMLLAGVLIICGLARRPHIGFSRPYEVRTLFVVSLVHGAGASILVVLASFPAARYIDCAGALTAALPLYAGLRMLGGPRQR